VLPVVSLLVALQLPVPADSQALPKSVAGIQHVDAVTSLAGPLAPAVVHLPSGPAGGAEVQLFNVNSRESLTVFLRFDGVTDEATAEELKRFLRCKRTGRKRALKAGVLALFAQVASHYPGKTIEVVSAVRARGYGAKNSKHYTGHAIDFRVRGVPSRKVREIAWALDGEIGVGHYTAENFIHIDYRPGESRIGWEQKREGSPNRYHPRWAKEDKPKARPSREARALRSDEPRW
jgi:uncharacterized protein YcbK (DUF882 family)